MTILDKPLYIVHFKKIHADRSYMGLYALDKPRDKYPDTTSVALALQEKINDCHDSTEYRVIGFTLRTEYNQYGNVGKWFKPIGTTALVPIETPTIPLDVHST